MTAITEEATEEQQRVSAETRPVSDAKVPPPRGSTGTDAKVVPVSGIVDVADGRGYLRTAGYRRSATDLPLTAGQVRKYGLRKGDQIDAIVTGDRNSAAGKRTANGQRPRETGRIEVTAVNGLPPALPFSLDLPVPLVLPVPVVLPLAARMPSIWSPLRSP